MNWSLDTTKFEWISFNGFEAKHKLSLISGKSRLYYDRNAPYTRPVKFYNTYISTTKVTAPAIYILPQAYVAVVERLQLNGVITQRLSKDTTMNVSVYYIDGHETSKNPYEAHYLHKGIKVRYDTQRIQYFKGDYVIRTNQISNRYIVETLEPEGGDSFLLGIF